MLLPKRGFYHPVAILVLAAITLSFAVIFYLNSSVFFKAPEKFPEAQSTASPAISPQSYPTDETVNWDTYTSPNKIFSTKYPQELSTTNQLEGVMSTVSPWNAEFTKPSDFRIEFSINSKEQSENLTDFADRVIKQQNSQIYNQNLLIPDSQKSLTVNGHQALWYVGNLGPATKHIEVYIQRNETSVLVVHLWDNNQPPSREHQTILNQILSTFKFLD